MNPAVFEPLPPDMQSPLTGGRFLPVGGHGAFVLERGVGFPVLLVHGMGASHHTWRRNLDALASGFHVVAPDLPGYGLSQPGSGFAYTVTEYSDYLAAAMTALGIERAHVVAHSFGGAVAENLARTAPDRVARMVLIGSSDLEHPIQADDNQKTKHLFLHSYRNKIAFDREAVAFARLVNRGGRIARTTRAVCAANLQGNRRTGRLPHPVLILWGSHDEIVLPEGAARLAGQFDDAEIRLIEDSGHACHEETSKPVNALIAEFLARPEPAASS